MPTLQGLAADFWSHLVDASDNLAYRLAYNSLRATYDQCRDLFTQVLAEEITDVARYRAIVVDEVAPRAASQGPSSSRRMTGSACAAPFSRIDLLGVT